jgi:hypothetical protein
MVKKSSDRNMIELLQSCQEEMNKLRAKNIFQSKNLMFINKMMMESWQKINHGSLYAEQGNFYAHSIDEDGNHGMTKKDKRFC